MAIAEGTILRLVASMVFPDSVIMQNVFHMVLETVVGDNDNDDIVTDLKAYLELLWTEIAPMIDGSIDSSVLTVYEYDPVDEDFDEVGTDLWSFTGSGSGGALPHGVAATMNLPTTDSDVQGRKFFGGFTEAAHDAGAWNSGALADLALAGIELIDPYTAAGTSNEYTNGVWSPTELAFFPYTNVVIIPTTPGYQRRRKPGVGI